MAFYKNWNWWLVLLMVALVMVRLPNLNRPLSKHHEYNSAVILINAESWKQAGGGSQFWFTPLMNFQGAGNRIYETGPHVDGLQNHVYLSFGAGWYVLPYLVFYLFQLQATPLNLQLISLAIGLLTVGLLYRLLNRITGNKQIALAATAIFATLPGPLWYTGNGYVSTAIMLPLVILIIELWHRFAISPKQITTGRLMALSLYTFALTYMDWLTPFLMAALGLWSFFQIKNSPRYGLVLATCAISTILSIWLVLAQFSQYLGWQQVLTYWQQRFGSRSANLGEAETPARMLLMLVKNIATAMGPLAIIIVVAIRNPPTDVRISTKKWPLLLLPAVLVYNLVFLNWSAVHEFAWLTFALVSVICLAVYVMPRADCRLLMRTTAAIVTVSLSMYYYINRPGTVSQNGSPYNEQLLLAKAITAATDSNTVIFTNLNNNKVVEYYARRTFNHYPDKAAALAVMKEFKLPEACWMQTDSNKLTGFTRLYLK